MVDSARLPHWATYMIYSFHANLLQRSKGLANCQCKGIGLRNSGNKCKLSHSHTFCLEIIKKEAMPSLFLQWCIVDHIKCDSRNLTILLISVVENASLNSTPNIIVYYQVVLWGVRFKKLV